MRVLLKVFLKNINEYMFNFSKIHPSVILISLLPIFFIIGSAALNILIVIICFFFMKQFFNFNDFVHIEKFEKWKIFFLIFFIYLLISSFFAEDLFKAFKASFSQIRFFILLLFIIFYFNPKNNIAKFVVPIWSLILLFVCVDTNIQFITGIDVFGYPAEGYLSENRSFFNVNIGRLGGPFGDELIVGSFISKFGSPLIFYYICIFSKLNRPQKIYSILFLILLIETVLLSGERSSFIIIFLSFLIALILYGDFKKNIIIFIISILSISTFVNINKFSKKRYQDFIYILGNFEESSYGRIYSSSIEVFKKNFFFGTGLKNYHNNCIKLKDPNPLSRDSYCSPNHSHNFVLQILSETGIIGFSLFYLFIGSVIFQLSKKLKRYNRSENLEKSFINGSIYICLFYVIPSIMPSGSFFTSWNGTIFWLNLGFVMSYFNKINER